MAEAYDWRFFLAAGVGLFVAQEALAFAGFPPSSAAYVVAVAGFLAVLAGLCLRNWRSCGSRHCLLTGGGYGLLALVALLAAAGAPVGTDAIWFGFALVVAVGIGASFLGEPGEARA